MIKKFLSFTIIIAIFMTMLTGFTPNTIMNEVNQDSKITTEKSQKTNSDLQKYTLDMSQSDKDIFYNMETINFEGLDKIDKLIDIDIQQKNVTARSNQVTSDSVINNTYGIFQGELTNENVLNYYLFSTTKECLSISKIITNNQNYTMILGIPNFETGKISLTNYGVYANKEYLINLPIGNYAWVIQSQNETYGDKYQLQYNYSLPKNSNNIVHASNDYQKIYTFSSGAFKLNNEFIDLDYKYDYHWQTNISTGPAWHTEKIWLENPTITKVVHIGGFRYKHGSEYVTYPNTVVLQVGEGGTFTHYIDQNPPRVFHDIKDMAGRDTPRKIDSYDLELYGSHYLVYDFDTGTVKEFVSGLSRQWSGSPDKTDPQLI